MKQAIRFDGDDDPISIQMKKRTVQRAQRKTAEAVELISKFQPTTITLKAFTEIVLMGDQHQKTVCASAIGWHRAAGRDSISKGDKVAEQARRCHRHYKINSSFVKISCVKKIAVRHIAIRKDDPVKLTGIILQS